MWFRCLVLLFCLTAICGQKGGRQSSASEANPSIRSPVRALGARKGIPQASEPIEQVHEPDREPDEDKNVVSGVRPSRPRPIAPRPDGPTEVEGHEPAPEPYSFSYSVDDPETGAASSREETQDANGEVVGYYHIKDAEGRTRRVDYTAGKDGFKATIKSNEEGLNARAPADVNIELSASPSEARPSYAPNNRPTGAESSIKNFGRAPSQKFYQKLVPPPSPLPAPSAPQPIEQVPEKAEDSQISQQYETSDASDPQEIVQQRNVDEEVPFESAPVKGGVPVAPVQPYRPPVQTFEPIRQPIQTIQPIQVRHQPVGTFTPQLSHSFREQGQVSFQPVLAPQPFEQVREEIPNNIQDVQEPIKPFAPVASTKVIPSAPVAPYQPAFRPLSPVLGGAHIGVAPVKPVPTATPQFSSFFHQSPPAQRPLQPLVSPPSNIIVQHSEHREPISQEQLINYLHPYQTAITPGQTITFDQTPQQLNVHPHVPSRPIQWAQPVQSGVTYVPQPPQPISPPAQEIITQERISEEPAQTIESAPVSESKVDSNPVVARPVPHVLPILRQPTFHYQPILPVWAQQNLVQTQPQQVPQTIQYNPLPAPVQSLPAPSRPLPQPVQQKQEFFDEPQVYEPAGSQTYEPLQQQAEDPAEESRAAPPAETVCECVKKAESRNDPVKGSAAELAPVKGDRLQSPVQSYIPQAFKSR